MELSTGQTKPVFSRRSFVVMLILLALRYPLLLLGEMEIIPSVIAFVVYLVGTYLLTALFVYENRANLRYYNITNIALLFFLCAPLVALLAGNDTDPTLWVRLGVAVVFAVLLFRKRKDWLRMEKIRIGSLLVNLLITGVLCVLLPLAIHAIRGFPVIDAPSGNIQVAFDIPYIWSFQLSSAAVSEEPLFRGILWGYLRTKGIKDGWIVLIQAGLFWLGHIYYIGTGINFWIVHPFTALLLGIVVWKTKSTAHSMTLHASINTFADYLRHVPYL
ncbi:CPBP family intramembrane metalloprotease [Christensenellaceae bacterium OttesenSCG-928-L17]|nr:CPBP family intramembrane metalloprotease [Christensenellaceae bacterium OttesenSCG-928-L17]